MPLGEVVAGIIGGIVGGVLGVFGTLVSSYYGPRKLEEWRANLQNRPRLELLGQLLNDQRFPDGRYLSTLCVYTGATEQDCRGLLIQMGARGIKLKDGEGWVLVKNKPFDQQ
jgi:hypothetical protein